jgi:hypothetical protein
MPQMGFKLMTPLFEQMKTVFVLGHVTIVIGSDII